LHEGIGFFRFFRVQIEFRLEIFDFGGDLRRILGRVEFRNPSDAGHARERVMPKGLRVVANRRDRAESRNHYTLLHDRRFLNH